MSERPLTVVVSGLPRSGTSLMMQMLDAGGIPPLTDDRRVPDQSNPKGYYELDAVKSLANDASCLDGAPGHAVKVIHRLLPHLPDGQRYGIIFVRRDLDEVVASQQAMLERLGATGSALDPRTLGAIFQKELDQAIGFTQRAPNTRLLEIEHRDAIRAPHETARTVEAFLRADPSFASVAFDTEAMARVVDPSLYRSQAKT